MNRPRIKAFRERLALWVAPWLRPKSKLEQGWANLIVSGVNNSAYTTGYPTRDEVRKIINERLAEQVKAVRAVADSHESEAK